MGVKSTVTLTREQAEDKYIRIYQRMAGDSLRDKLKSIQDADLELLLEHLNDIVNDDEGFENYNIEG